MKTGHALVLAVLLFEAFGFRARAEDGFSGFRSHRWQVEDGLPHNVVQAVTQTSDGFLWIGTRGGLARFDGVRFVPIDFGTNGAPPSITSLCQSKDGSLWIGTDKRGLFRLHEGNLSHYGRSDGLPDDSVAKVLADGETVWIATAGGLARWQPDKITRVQAAKLAQNSLSSLCLDQQGALWVGSSRRLQRLFDGEVATYRTANGVPLRGVNSLFAQADGIILIGHSGGLVSMEHGEFVNYPKGEGPAGIVSVVLRDGRGNLWVGTLGGLNRFDGTNFISERRYDGASYAIYALFEDRENDLWVGSEEGLTRFTPKHFVTYTKQEGLSQNAIASLCASHDGGLWIGTWGGGLNKLRDGKISVLRESDGLSSDFVMAVDESHDGAVWAGTDFGHGLNRIFGRNITQYRTNDALSAFAITALAEGADGAMWIGSREGLYRLHDGHATRYTTADGLSQNHVNVLCRGAEDTLLIGTRNGLTVWNSNRFTIVQPAALKSSILSLYDDANGVLWIGTQGSGLARLSSGKLHRFTQRQGLASDSIYSIVEDDLHNLWFSSDKGIFWVSKAALNRVAENHAAAIVSTLYGKSDGLVADSQYQQFAQPSSCRTSDGRLWFQTIQGIASIDPSHIIINTQPPSVRIEEIIGDKGLFPVGANHSPVVEIPPGRGEIEIHYTALSLQAAEKNRFRYKLEGLDSDWVDAGSRRTAYYNNLSPGKYVFNVKACNNDGVWNAVGAKIGFQLLPHVWQTWWFIGLCGATAVGGVAGVALYSARRRMQRKVERLQQQNAVERERARIARDMHDELGAKLTRISFQGAVAARSLANPSQAELEIGKMTDTARALVTSLDEIVWAVDPENDSLENLANYICRYATEFFENSNTACEFVIPPKLPDVRLSSAVRHHLFLAVKETLNNVLKHANASRLELRITAETEIFSIIMADDGRGIEPSQNGKRGGHGLVNLHERLAAIEGRCIIDSKPGIGTRVELVIRSYD